MIIKGKMPVRVVSFLLSYANCYLTGLLRRIKHTMRIWRMSNGIRNGR